jgi:hypothetical protein
VEVTEVEGGADRDRGRRVWLVVGFGFEMRAKKWNGCEGNARGLVDAMRAMER